VIDLCHAFLDEGFIFTWNCASHPNPLDFDTMKLMRRADAGRSRRDRVGLQRIWT
jgi:hypothetical protein